MNFTRSLTMLCLLHTSFLFANYCENPVPANGQYLHANHVRALFTASGSCFWDGDNSNYYIEGSDAGINTIFAGGLWLGGINELGFASTAIAGYGLADGRSDYYPGPLDADGTVSSTTCGNYDRVWSVRRYEIEAHIADFQDNGFIDNPIPAVVGWPGRGNAQFIEIYGFALPMTAEGLAPFADLNGDGDYQPLEGEYPIVPQSGILPDQMIWSVYNTAGGPAQESNTAYPLTAEVQQLSWAFYCINRDLINNSIFTSYRIINRGTESYTDMRVGIWNDFDLGCYADDAVGSAPALNAYYCYNRDSVDDNPCENGAVGAGENPPVQSVIFLNQAMTNFMALDPPYPIPSDYPVNNPYTAPHYYNFLTSRFLDGTPVTEGGDGYNPDSTEEPVHFMFPDNPNDPDSWSFLTSGNWFTSSRPVGAVSFPVWSAGEVLEVDIAYAYHREDDGSYLDNVNVMYEDVAFIQSLYHDNFNDFCAQETICQEDCIWSGDMNADGIANHEDILALGFGISNNEQGALRFPPYNWTARDGNNWSGTQLNNANTKHLDANGDGLATLADFDQTRQHYNFVRPDYQPTYEYPPGDEISFKRTGPNPDLVGLSPGQQFFARVRLEVDIDDLRGLAFSLEYDPQYFNNFSTLGATWLPSMMTFLDLNTAGVVDFARYDLDEDSYIESGSLAVFSIQVLDIPPELLESDETFIRFRNIRAYLSDGTAVDLGAQEVRVQINDVAVKTGEPAWGAAVTIFPNPVSDKLRVLNSGQPIDSYEVIDAFGRPVQTGILRDNLLSVNDLAAGLYYLRLRCGEEAIVRKWVKM